MRHKSTISSARTIVTGLVLLVGLQFTAGAETYTYTGPEMSDFASSPYTTTDNITGMFTIASLGNNFLFGSITPTSYSFSDGVQTISSTSPPPDVTFEVATGPTGNISAWFINLESPSPFFQIATSSTPNDEDQAASSNGQAYEFGGTSNWVASSGTGGTGTVPEPGYLGFLGLGLAAIVLVQRKLQRVRA